MAALVSAMFVGGYTGSRQTQDPDGHGAAVFGDGDRDSDESPADGDDWFTRQRLFPNAHLDLGAALGAARGEAADLRTATAKKAGTTAVPAWQSLGPANGGRITDLVADPAHSGVVYAAAASGGVWKSTDGGGSFHYSWNTGLVQAIGALAVTGTGVLYAGTGEANPTRTRSTPARSTGPADGPPMRATACAPSDPPPRHGALG